MFSYIMLCSHQFISYMNSGQLVMQYKNHAQSEYKHSLTFHVWHYVVIATKPMHWLQICSIVHN